MDFNEACAQPQMMFSIFTTLVTTIIGTGVGAYAGALFILRKQESTNIYPRKLINNIIDSFKKYKNFNEVNKEFNRTYSLVQKKAVLVALKNLGIPVRVNIIDDRFDIDNIIFDSSIIEDNALKEMKKYVDMGLCDNLFFKEIDSSFHNSSPKIILARKNAIKVLETMKKQKANITAGELALQADLSWNQFEVINVFWKTLMVDNIDGSNDEGKIDAAIQDVKNGIFDHLYYWDSRAYQNMYEQIVTFTNLNANLRLLPLQTAQNNQVTKNN